MIFPRWKRRSHTANVADPTQVTVWEFGKRNFQISLVASWGVEAKIYFMGRKFWSYDAWWAIRLYDFLENQWEAQQMDYEEDPMGRLSDYE